MEKENISFKNYISSLKDERLIEIINIEYKEYTEEALGIIREELISRGFEDVLITDNKQMPTLRDLILQVRFEDVQKFLVKEFHCDKEVIEKLRTVFHQLLSLTATHNENVYITVDKQYDELLKTVSDWDIYGIEANAYERFSVDLYKWNDWLSFNVRTENINLVGKDLFVACCLLKMTTFGYNSEEIESKLIDLTSESDVIGNKDYPADSLNDNEPVVHPWIRLWARNIDIILFATILNNILVFAPIELRNIIIRIEYIMPVSLFLWVLFESLLLSTWGTTPGKLLLGITVRENGGSILTFSRALNRSASVWFYGMGCGVIIIELIANISSYNRLSKKGITRWDFNGKYSISHNEISSLNIIIATMIIIGLSILSSLDFI